MALDKGQRQAVMDEYMAATGANMVKPRDFLAWLSPQTDHVAWPWFFAVTDEDAALAWRVAKFRQFAAGLRIHAEVHYSNPVTQEVSVKVTRLPAYVSPLAGRAHGGGYVRNDASPEALEELRSQGGVALRAWLKRYRGAFEAAGVDLSPVDEIAGSAVAGVVAAD